MRGLKIAALLTVAAAGGASYGAPEYYDAFMSHYKLRDNSPFAEKGCAICHVSDSDFGLNPYGRDLKKAEADAGKSQVDVAILESVEALDSDGDGTSNGEEIRAQTLPGDPSSGGKPGAATAASAQPAKKPATFPPKNGFHPAVVHFPIALFIAALVLDLIGVLRNARGMMFAGWYNMVLGAITALAGVATGFLAMYLTKFPLRGLVREHMLYAVAATVIMWIMVLLRVHRHERMNVPMRIAYYILGIGGLLLIAWAGHLGGVLVYGE
jgi:uncharacterized membrane protein